jgi:hypothetical protein
MFSSMEPLGIANIHQERNMILLTTKILIYYLLLELFLSISNIYSLFTFYKIKYLYYILIIFMYLYVCIFI